MVCHSVHSVEKREILSRQNNYLVISLVKPLLSRNFCEKSVREFLQFPHCGVDITGILSHTFLAKLS